jgi:hypothetical protein
MSSFLSPAREPFAEHIDIHGQPQPSAVGQFAIQGSSDAT